MYCGAYNKHTEVECMTPKALRTRGEEEGNTALCFCVLCDVGKLLFKGRIKMHIVNFRTQTLEKRKRNNSLSQQMK